MQYFNGVCLLLATALVPCTVSANKLSFVVNGKSFHSSNTYQVSHTNINYTCNTSTAQIIDVNQVPADCRELNRETSTVTKKYNEDNSGFGLVYEFKRKNNTVPYISVGQFRDSFETDARYISGGLNKYISLNKKFDNLHLEYGGVISVIDSPSYANGRAIVTFMPVLSISTDTIGINLTFLPKINNRTTNVFFIQIETTLIK